MIIFTIDLRLS